MRFSFLAAAIAIAVAPFPSAFAGDSDSSKISATSSDWTVTVGAETRFEPSFEGANRNIVWPYPLLDIRRAGTQNIFALRATAWVSELLRWENLRWGLSASTDGLKKRRMTRHYAAWGRSIGPVKSAVLLTIGGPLGFEVGLRFGKDSAVTWG